MKTDFYNPACESLTSAHEFGVYDTKSKTARIDSDNRELWVACVSNKNQTPVVFTAIDNCIFSGSDEKGRRCDGMITYPDNIIFIELKEQRTSPWVSHTVEQLENTILLFVTNHNLAAIRNKRAFAANKSFPNFQHPQPADYQRFFKKYRVKLHIDTKIII
ncbi:MAG: hypothetical protein V4543_01935 [Bacteroidota bacterium]